MDRSGILYYVLNKTQVQDGDTCSLVSIANYIGLADFYFLNPEIDADCTNLDLGISYCVEAVGSISTYSGYSMAGPTITLMSSTISISTSTSSTSYVGSVTSESALPTASGTIANCAVYRNYIAPTNTTATVNDCQYVAYAWGVSTSDLNNWNPSLVGANCTLLPGLSYCVQQTVSASGRKILLTGFSSHADQK